MKHFRTVLSFVLLLGMFFMLTPGLHSGAYADVDAKSLYAQYVVDNNFHEYSQFALVDVNGDGVEELLAVRAQEVPMDPIHRSMDVYTIDNGSVVPCYQGEDNMEASVCWWKIEYMSLFDTEYLVLFYHSGALEGSLNRYTLIDKQTLTVAHEIEEKRTLHEVQSLYVDGVSMPDLDMEKADDEAKVLVTDTPEETELSIEYKDLTEGFVPSQAAEDAQPIAVITTSSLGPAAAEPAAAEPDLPTAGTSTAGTELRNIRYNADGSIRSLSENVNGDWIDWEYVYDSFGFQYRRQNIGTMATRTSHSYMPGTDITYDILASAVENCVGFELDYQVSNLRSGNGLGPRIVYVSPDRNSWENLGSFEYNSYDEIHVRIDFSKPATLYAYAMPRQYPDGSSFNVSQTLTAIWVADYDFVELA